MRRLDGAITMILAVVLAVGAVTWVIVTQTRSPGATSTRTPVLTQTATGFFSTDATVIPAGGCVKLSWSMPRATEITLRGSNWPEDSAEIVEDEGTMDVCPSAALNYEVDKPVDYTLTATFPDGSERIEVITISYE